MISPAAVIIALGLPWLAAVIWLRLLFPAPAPGRWPMLLGYGYLFGLIGTTLLLRLQAAAGLGLGFWFPVGVWACLVAAGWWRSIRDPSLPGDLAVASPDRATGSDWRVTTAITVLLVLIGGRLLVLALDAWWLPLFPWDAWTTWAVRAEVWAHAHDLVPFVSPQAWLEQPASGAYSIAAWNYPITVSLIATWPALAFGSWNETAANLPWLGGLAALCLAFYGQARLWGIAPLTTLLFLWLLVSLPMLDTHVALAGYADLWMAIALGLAFFAFLQWSRHHDWAQGLLALVAALIGLLIKKEGAVWILIFLPALAAARLPWKWLILLIALPASICILILLGPGASVAFPGIGDIVINANQIELPLIGTFSLRYSGSWGALFQHVAILDNWHLLVILVPASLAIALFLMTRNPGNAARRAGFAWVVSALFAVFILFFWTNASEWLRQGTSINRILLQFMPALIFWMLALWNELNTSFSLVGDRPSDDAIPAGRAFRQASENNHDESVR